MSATSHGSCKANQTRGFKNWEHSVIIFGIWKRGLYVYTGRQLQTEYPLIITVHITYLAAKYVPNSSTGHIKQINEADVTKKIINLVKMTHWLQEDSHSFDTQLLLCD